MDKKQRYVLKTSLITYPYPSLSFLNDPHPQPPLREKIWSCWTGIDEYLNIDIHQCSPAVSYVTCKFRSVLSLLIDTSTWGNIGVHNGLQTHIMTNNIPYLIRYPIDIAYKHNYNIELKMLLIDYFECTFVGSGLTYASMKERLGLAHISMRVDVGAYI